MHGGIKVARSPMIWTHLRLYEPGHEERRPLARRPLARHQKTRQPSTCDLRQSLLYSKITNTSALTLQTDSRPSGILRSSVLGNQYIVALVFTSIVSRQPDAIYAHCWHAPIHRGGGLWLSLCLQPKNERHILPSSL